MSEATHQAAVKGGHLWVRLLGTLDEDIAAQIAEDVRGKADALPASAGVAFDLRKMEGCKLLARAELRGLQEHLAAAGRRTAWLSDRPRFRGLALLICHNSKDPKAGVFPTETQALEWFSAEGSRFDVADRVAERLKSLKTGGAR